MTLFLFSWSTFFLWTVVEIWTSLRYWSQRKMSCFILLTGTWKRVFPPWGTLDFKWSGWSIEFSGFEILDSGIFFGGGVGKFGKYVFGWLDLSGDFLGIQHNLRFVVVSAFLSCIHVFLRIKYNQTCFAFWKLCRIKMQYGFSVVNFWSRDFWGFCWNYGTLGIFSDFDFCPRPIIPVFWNPENSPLGSFPWHWD